MKTKGIYVVIKAYKFTIFEILICIIKNYVSALSLHIESTDRCHDYLLFPVFALQLFPNIWVHLITITKQCHSILI